MGNGRLSFTNQVNGHDALWKNRNHDECSTGLDHTQHLISYGTDTIQLAVRDLGVLCVLR